jgi:hypothetical protein
MYTELFSCTKDYDENNFKIGGKFRFELLIFPMVIKICTILFRKKKVFRKHPDAATINLARPTC